MNESRILAPIMRLGGLPEAVRRSRKRLPEKMGQIYLKPIFLGARSRENKSVPFFLLFGAIRCAIAPYTGYLTQNRNNKPCT